MKYATELWRSPIRKVEGNRNHEFFVYMSNNAIYHKNDTWNTKHQDGWSWSIKVVMLWICYGTYLSERLLVPGISSPPLMYFISSSDTKKKDRKNWIFVNIFAYSTYMAVTYLDANMLRHPFMRCNYINMFHSDWLLYLQLRDFFYGFCYPVRVKRSGLFNVSENVFLSFLQQQ